VTRGTHERPTPLSSRVSEHMCGGTGDKAARLSGVSRQDDRAVRPLRLASLRGEKERTP
jgi:hypothetical protein